MLHAGYEKVAVGFCYKDWAVLRLGSKKRQPPLVNCVSIGYATLLIKNHIDEIAVPIQIPAPVFDPVFMPEPKTQLRNAADSRLTV